MPGVGYDTLFDSDGDNSAQAIKTSGGRLYGMEISNPNSVDAYVQLFDVATGSVTVGATAPKQSYLVPGGDGTLDGAFDINFASDWMHFHTAISYSCTTTATGSGDPSTGLVCNFWFV
jgi:hypothetical protein